jgi:hypothetical protein
MSNYTFAACLETSHKVNWKIEDVIGGKEFDLSKRWIPASLSASSRVEGFTEKERRLLSHVEMAAYAHIFAYVEEFIAPKVSELALEHENDDRVAYDALTNFAKEEVKHMTLFKQLRDQVNQTVGFETDLIGNQAESAHYVLSKSTGAVLLLTACIEWFTQRHFTEAFRDDDDLDPLTKDVFRAHWLEESQHAQMDHLETLREFRTLDDQQRDKAVDELIELVAAVDGLLMDQVERDIANFITYLGRDLSASELDDLRGALVGSKRWTFIQSGVTHPRFIELIEAVTTASQQERIGSALESLFGEG